MIRVILACLPLAGLALLAATAFGPLRSLHGSSVIREIRQGVAVQQGAFTRLARGGELERAMGSGRGGRACHWHRGTAGWTKTCRPAG